MYDDQTVGQSIGFFAKIIHAKIEKIKLSEKDENAIAINDLTAKYLP